MVPDSDDKKPTGGVRGTRHRLRGPSRIEPTAPAIRPAPVPENVPENVPKNIPIKPVSARQTASNARPAGAALSPKSVPEKKRVLFICIGNSCRSQMAEAFARAYGSDIMEVQSAGINPASYIAPLTKQTLSELNLNIDDHYPKGLDLVRGQHFDVAVNMSGLPWGLAGVRVIEWTVPDPIGQKESVFRSVATQIEGLVMRLVMELRTTPEAIAVRPKI